MRPRLLSLLFLAVLIVLAPSLSRAATRASPSGAEAVAQSIWNKLLTHCGESYFYAGSPFDSAGMLSNVQVAHQSTMEYRGVKFHLVPIRVTDAERANGLTYRARISMMAHLYREKGGNWLDGPDLQPRNIDDMFGQALSQVGSDMFDMGSGGAIALELDKFQGAWVVTRSSATSSSSIGFGTKYFDVGKLLNVRIGRYSCASASIVMPPPTAAEIAAQKAAIQKQEDDQRKFREEMVANAAIKAAALNAWGFTGSIEDFRAALITNLNKRAPQLDSRPIDYRDDVDRIMRIVQTCTNLARDQLEAYWKTRLDWRDREAIHNCDGLASGGGRFGPAVSPAGNRKRAIAVEEHVYETDPVTHRPVMPRYFAINIYFDTNPVDPYIEPHHIDEAYIVLSAKVEMKNYVSEQSLQTAERAVRRDATKGIPFVAISDFQFTALKSYYDDTGASRFIDKRMPDGSSAPIEFYTFQQMIGRFPQSPRDDEWLAPGTTYETPCRAMIGARCRGLYASNAVTGSHSFVVVHVTSGLHQGQYALIDKANYVAEPGFACAGQAGAPC